MNDRRTALVTGGAKRVGRAIVEKLSNGGFDIIFTYNSSDSDAKSLHDRLVAEGKSCQIIKINLDSENAAVEIARSVNALAPRLDLLVNNASIYLPDAPDADFSRRTMQINYLTPVALVRELAMNLRKAKGHVVNMLDILADRPMTSYSIYSASKSALKNATIALARELAPEVTVNGISPGVVDWPDDMPVDQREAYLAKVPLRRAGTPADVASLVHFLATEGTYITGQDIRLDGGRSLV